MLSLKRFISTNAVKGSTIKPEKVFHIISRKFISERFVRGLRKTFIKWQPPFHPILSCHVVQKRCRSFLPSFFPSFLSNYYLFVLVLFLLLPFSILPQFLYKLFGCATILQLFFIVWPLSKLLSSHFFFIIKIWSLITKIFILFAPKFRICNVKPSLFVITNL